MVGYYGGLMWGEDIKGSDFTDVMKNDLSTEAEAEKSFRSVSIVGGGRR